jgi:hypothetical protein
MEQQRSLADYAQSLDISPASLRAILMAQLDQVEPSTLDRLADRYQQSRETLRDHVSMAPPQESFAAWLKRNMEGMSQHALRTRVQLDSKTLKHFLNGDMLPDSDQAERLARALYIDRTELARVVTATMIQHAADGQLVDMTGTSADPLMPSLASTDQQGMIRSPRPRRQKATSRAEQTSPEGAVANGGTTTAAAVKEPRTEPEADSTRTSTARRQAGTKLAARSSSPTTPSPAEPISASERGHTRQPAADRLAGTTTTAASELTANSPVGAMASQDNPTLAATGSDVSSTSTAPTQRSTRKQRRSGTVAERGPTDAASPTIVPRKGEALVRQDAKDRSAPPDRNDPMRSTSDASVVPATTALPPANTLRQARSTASTTSALELTPALIPSVVAAETTTLQLTADEVRLIRHWRQLHPHGRRATLHYIGSLLVED